MNKRISTIKYNKIIIILISILLTIGCTENQILQRLKVYFPNAILLYDKPNAIHIETNVHGVSQEFVKICFDKFLEEYSSKAILDQIEGKKEIIFGFEEYQVKWEIGSNHYYIYRK